MKPAPKESQGFDQVVVVVKVGIRKRECIEECQKGREIKGRI